jgi:type III secretory pathway component EscT
MRISSTKDLTLSGLFITMGLLLPIVFHGVGIGAVFLAMFWPVAASGFIFPI